MAWPALKERQNHVLKGHPMMILPYGRRRTLREQVCSLNSPVADYLGIPTFGHYGVVQSGPPADGQPSAPGSGRGPGAAIELGSVVGPSRRAGADADPGAPGAGQPGVSLLVPPGQSVALLSQPPAAATGLFDAIAGLSRPRAGLIRVDGVAVNRLGRAELDRYRARRGLVSPRFSLLPSLSVLDNVLAAPPVGRDGPPSADRAMRLLELAGAARLTGPVGRLSAEEQWRIMIARALVSSPRLLLAEDPAPGLDAAAAADRVLDVLMDAHAMFGFTLVLTANRPATAVRCQRRVLVAGGRVVEDDLTSGDDAWTRSRIDRIG
jgi:predicted ABC-type transport system involved in lysophospholipase L1 biosynthesis ATPase subunit